MWFNQNDKMKKSSKNGVLLVDFSQPAGMTCPRAGACQKGCYAGRVYARAGDCMTKLDVDWSAVIAELADLKKKADKQRLILIVRIHSSGDFSTQEYIDRWQQIFDQFSAVEFYFYTKSHSAFDWNRPTNAHMISSFGGLDDDKIDTENQAHAHVFLSADDLEKAGYIDCSADDYLAYQLSQKPGAKIGLVYHGPKCGAYSTWKKAA